MKRSQQSFFQDVSTSYGDFIKARGSKEELRPWIETRMGRRVLDIGNGGIRDFISPVTQQYVGLDFSLSMLKQGGEGIEKVCGDALCLPFKRETFDTLFYRSMLHHLTEGGSGETEARVKQVLTESLRLLKKGGNVIIVEPCISPWLERLEKIFHFFVRIFFRVIQQPEVFIFSAEHLKKVLEESVFGEIFVRKVGIAGSRWRWVSPVIGLPKLKVPLALLPVNQVVLEAKKGC
jgi:ubiquinone/menaquinone biosynthesis C-methylase UbiE